MMLGYRISLLAVLALAMLTACRQDKSYVVEGSIYGGRNFEDQTIYLVPFSGSTAGKVDSATIHDGRFRFDGSAPKSDICILRMRPMMRLFIEELIIVREPGRVRVKLSDVSSAAGTPLNDSLQSWRDYKRGIDEQMTELKKKKRKAPPAEQQELNAAQDSLKRLFDIRNRASMTANENNAFGEFLESWIVR